MQAMSSVVAAGPSATLAPVGRSADPNAVSHKWLGEAGPASRTLLRWHLAGRALASLERTHDMIHPDTAALWLALVAAIAAEQAADNGR